MSSWFLSCAPEVHSNDGLNTRRRLALGEALSEISTDPGYGRGSAIAVRGYGTGCLALALGGVFDPPAQRELRALCADLDRWAGVELAVELSQLVGCPPALVRVITGLRMRRLVAGARVELHNPPHELVVDLGHAPATAFSLAETGPSPSAWTGSAAGARVGGGR